MKTNRGFADAMTPENDSNPYGRAVPRLRDSEMRKLLKGTCRATARAARS